jgi:hypothetical protein
MRTLLYLTIVLALALGTTVAANAQDDLSSPEAIVAATYEAINAGDIDAYMALFAEDAEVTVGPWYTFTGQEEIRASAQETFDAAITFEYEILAVDDGAVTVWSKHQPPDTDFPLEATEEFVVEDGKIVFNAWNPTEETMRLLAGPQLANHLLNGVYDLVFSGVFPATEDDPVETPFSMIGCIVADGDGNIVGGARRLNFAGDLQTDSLDGAYTVTEDGKANLTLNAYQDGEQAATEDLACYVSLDSQRIECIFTAVTVPAESAVTNVPVVGSAHGSHRMIN